MDKTITIFWFRRDLRLEDNTALFHALRQNEQVLPVFIFDTNILNKLEDPNDARVAFIQHTVETLQIVLQKTGSDLKIFYGEPVAIFKKILATYPLKNIYANHDYEKYGIERDHSVMELAKLSGVGFFSYKDIVIFEKDEILKDNLEPYTIFTPYSRKWKAKLNTACYQTVSTEPLFGNFYKTNPSENIKLESMGFIRTDLVYPTKIPDETIIRNYTEKRDYPFVQNTTKLGLHLRFGTISIRMLTEIALATNETFLNELIWRDFYHMILYQFPYINNGAAFKKKYDQITWRNNEQDFSRWCEGQTGYPIVDAGMRELNATGLMHNRVRMITASFLCKHLLLDWRWGEAYFAKKLLDFDFAANNGGWQWASGSGCDAAPYFRIFNPALQTKKFDKDLLYTRKWVPELNDLSYPQPMVVHEFARKRCIETYSTALKNTV